METKRLRQEANRLDCYLALIEKTEKQISDINQRVEIEENKPYLEAYLTTSRDWFEDRADYLEYRKQWLVKRTENIIKNLQQ